MEIVIFIIIELLWGWLAPKASCVVRNGIALAMPVLFLLMLLIKCGNRLLMVLPVVSLIWCIAVGAFVLAEKFPRKPERHAMRRSEVTFLQDGLFLVHLLMMCFLFML